MLAAPEDPFRLRRIAIDGQGEEVGTFARAGHRHVAKFGPLFQIGRGEQGVSVSVEEQGHDPLLARGVPEHFGIAVVAGDMLEHRVAGVLGPSAAAVVAVGDRLREGTCPAEVKMQTRVFSLPV